MSHPVLKTAGSALDAALECAGDMSLLDRPRRTLLISRAERSPEPASAWLRATVGATRKIAEENEVLVTGTGRIAFDAALWTSRRHHGAAIVALSEPPEDPGEHIPSRRLLVWPKVPLKGKPALLQRDRLMAALADRACSIHIRPGGTMAKLAAEFLERGCPVDHCPGAAVIRPRKKQILHSREFDIGDWQYVTHFTREPGGAWPGESYSSYLEWLVTALAGETRGAFESLCRILSERRVRACGRLMPERVPMVCLTELPPPRVLELRRWRRGLLRWSFTCYGVAIEKQFIAGLGARKVLYATRAEIEAAPPVERPFMQTRNSGTFDWSAEEEWRIAGDIDLSRVPDDALRAIVETPQHAAFIRKNYSIETIAPLS